LCRRAAPPAEPGRSRPEPVAAAEFARAVLRLLEDTTLAGNLAETGRQLVDQRYRWERVVGDLEAFYDELLARTQNTLPQSRKE